MVTSHLIEHLEKLSHFIAIAEAGSFAKAALDLRMTQPTLSHAVKVLEGVLGIDLFHRSSTGIELTQAGERLYRFSKQLVMSATEVEQELRLREEAHVGRVTFGTKEPYGISLWPEYLKLLEPLFPKVEFVLRIRRSNAELMKDLLEENLEAILLPDPPENEGVIAYQMFKDSLGFFAAPAYLEKKGKGIEGLPVYMFQNAMCGNGKTVHAILKNFVPVLPTLHDVDSYPVAKSLCQSGLGLALLPKSLVQSEVKSHTLVSVKHPLVDSKAFGETHLCLCFNRKTSRHKLLRSFLKTVREYHYPV